VLTNQPVSTAVSGSVMLLKRPGGQVLGSAPLNVAAGKAYQLSVMATTTWTTANPFYPSSTLFTVSVDGVQLLSRSDASYFSGRFGVNASNVEAHFTCLQANNGPLPPGCPLTPPLGPTSPPPILPGN
jgi:hypothetical protein